MIIMPRARVAKFSWKAIQSSSTRALGCMEYCDLLLADIRVALNLSLLYHRGRSQCTSRCGLPDLNYWFKILRQDLSRILLVYYVMKFKLKIVVKVWWRLISWTYCLEFKDLRYSFNLISYANAVLYLFWKICFLRFYIKYISRQMI